LIKKHAISEALKMREEGSTSNKLIDKLAKEPEFIKAGITKEILEALLVDKSHFLGNAKTQIDYIIEKAKPLLDKYSDEARYEPNDIL
jgi:adenylosuccinate lyase